MIFITTVCAESGKKPSPPSQGNSYNSPPVGMSSFASVENLMMDMTLNAQRTDLQFTEMRVHNEPGNPGVGASNHLPHTNVKNVTQNPKLRRSETTASILETKKRPLLRSCTSVASVPRMETFFGVDNSEPCTQVYHHQQQAEMGDHGYYSSTELPQQPQTEIKSTEQFTSVMSMESRYGLDEPFQNYEQKCFSTNDLTRVKPFPENKLANRDRKASWVSVKSHGSLPAGGPGTDHDDYGYTIVLSSVPKSNNELRRRAYSGGAYLDSDNASHPKTSHRSRTISVGSGTSLNSRKPPPYIPPPSYASVIRKQSVNGDNYTRHGEDASISSYETACTHFSGDASFLRSNQSLAHPAQCSVPGEHSRPRSLALSHKEVHKSKSSLADSYKQAIESTGAASTPVGRSLFGMLRRTASSPGKYCDVDG